MINKNGFIDSAKFNMQKLNKNRIEKYVRLK